MKHLRLFLAALLGTASSVLLRVVRRQRRSKGIAMDQRPFRPLATPRNVVRTDLPAELRQFYARNEGVGLERSPESMVRLCLLSEVEKHAWRDVHIFGKDEPPPGWDDFEAFSIGISSYLDWIYLVQQAPCCPPGSILTIGVGIAGPGGRGEHTFECALVLASSFDEWLTHLERNDWFEYGLYPGRIWELPAARQSELRTYYKAMNPGIDWETPPPPDFEQ